MFRIITMTVVLILNFVLQCTWLQVVEIRGIMPNTALCMVVSYALLRGSFEGGVLGFFSGLLQDIFFGYAIGFYALLGMLCGVFAGIFNKNFYRENYILPFVLTIAAAFFYGFSVYITHYMFQGNMDLWYFLQNKIIPEVVYTTLVSFAVYQLMYLLNKKIESRKRYKANQF